MATTVTSTRPEKISRAGGGPKLPGPNGKGPKGNGWRGDNRERKFSPAVYRIAMWVVLAAIVMMFAAMSAVYMVLVAGAERQQIAVPRMFFVSTVLIVASSVTFEVARRRLKDGQPKAYTQWLTPTLALGVAFLGTQLLAWRELKAQGVYLAGNPRSSFFYLFTAVHGAHLLGGMIALLYLVLKGQISKSMESERTQASADVVSRYWHAMDGLWIWLFMLLLVWR